MLGKHLKTTFQRRFRIHSFGAMTLVVIVLITACNLPTEQIVEETPIPQDNYSDPNARIYQMYFDSFSDSAENELQVRRFTGHLHLASIENIFGDPQSLELDENCNYAGGPILAGGLIWYVSLTPDLVGANLISISPDGTISSSFDLDGDRVADIVDIRLGDNRRISFLTEEFGLDVFNMWLRGQDPFCETDLARQLGLPSLGCNDTGSGSSGGGGGFGGSGIVDPLDMLCSEHDTGTQSKIISRGPARTRTTSVYSDDVYGLGSSGIRRNVQTWVVYDSNTGEHLYTHKLIVDTYWRDSVRTGSTPEIVQITDETVYPDESGHRETITYANGRETSREEGFQAEFNPPDNPYDEDPDDYNLRESNPPPDTPRPPSGSGSRDSGPEGDDTAIAEFCQRRANHQSGVEQAASTDPSSNSVSCNDLVGAPSNGDCMIIEWARPEDFKDALHPSSDDDGCDTFQQAGESQSCEPTSIKERLRGLTAEIWSLDLPDITLCPPFACDPAGAAELQTYVSGDIEAPACPIITGRPTLVPSEANCPPGTYFAPATNRCIDIQVPSGGSGDNSSGACNLSISACSAQGLSFNSNECKCEPIQ